MAYVLTLTLAFILATYLTVKSNFKSQFLIILLYLFIAFLSIFLGQINKDVIRILGGPFNYQWLYYSNFLKGREAVNAIIFNSSWTILSEFMKLSFIMVLIFFIFYFLLSIILQKINIKSIHLISIIGLLIIYLLVASWYVHKKHWDLSNIENPIISFLKSIITSQSSPVLFTMESHIDPEDFQSSNESPLNTARPNNWKKFHIKNVVIFVLESVPAEFIYNIGNHTPQHNTQFKRILKRIGHI